MEKHTEIKRNYNDEKILAHFKRIRFGVNHVSKEKQDEMWQLIEQDYIDPKEFKRLIKKWDWTQQELEVLLITEDEEKQKEVLKMWKKVEDEYFLNCVYGAIFLFIFILILVYNFFS